MAKRVKNKLEERKAWQPVKMNMYKMPDLLPENMTWEQRFQIIKEMGISTKKAFDKKFPGIQKWFSEYNAIYLLSYCAVYFLSHPEGTDPEVEGSIEFYPHYLEILQAFALMQEESLNLAPLFDNSKRLKKEMKEIGQAMQYRIFGALENTLSERELLQMFVLETTRSQTTAIRGWAYSHQIEKTLLELAELVKDDFLKVYGLDAPKFFSSLLALIFEANNKLNDHFEKLRRVMKQKNHTGMAQVYHQLFPTTKLIEGEELEYLWKMGANQDIAKLSALLWCHADLRLQDILTIDIKELVAKYGDLTKHREAERVLDYWSIAFGELSGQNIEHIILNNPVWARPFVKLSEGKYFSAILGLLLDRMVSLLENLITIEGRWAKRYSDRIKSTYLEDKLERLFKDNFPNSNIYRGSQWRDQETGKLYENDLIVVMDTFAIVVEAKSGKISPSARRGSFERLRRDIHELIEEPAVQANRFIEFLKTNKQMHEFTIRDGRNNKFDSSQIRYYVPIGITFEQFGAIATNQKELIEVGLINKKMSELAPSICFADLENIFTLLEFDAEKVHYFVRRRELESHVAYIADEMDLLAFYLDNGFNIGKDEFENRLVMNLLLKSKELDPYFIESAEGKDVEKPRLEMTQYWKDLLQFIADRKTQYWLETSFILLNTTNEDQEQFLSKFEEYKRKVKLGDVKQKYNWVNFVSGSPKRSFLISGFPYKGTKKAIRNDVITGILNQEEEILGNPKGAVCIGINVDNETYPYSVLASGLETELFTDLDSFPLRFAEP